MKLFRPVGLFELEKIEASGWKAFPPRFDWQPIFYPVLNQRYAREIAERWNTTDAASGFAGFVLAFEVLDEAVSQYPIQIVGGAHHEELWVPAEELEAFNAAIVGGIRLVETVYGEQYTGKQWQLST